MDRFEDGIVRSDIRGAPKPTAPVIYAAMSDKIFP